MKIKYSTILKDCLYSRLARKTLKTRAPHFITLAVTNRCNSRCTMCNIWKRSDFSDELTLDDYAKLFNRPFFNNLKMVSLTGGEPFLRRDILQIIKLILKIDPTIKITINTNGLLSHIIEETTRNILSENPGIDLKLSISLDAQGEVFNKIRGINNAYSTFIGTVDKLEALRALFPECLDINISYTLLPSNYNEILNIYHFTKKRDFGFSCRPAQISNHFYGNTHQQFVFSEDALEAISKQIQNVKTERNDFIINHIPAYLSNPKVSLVPCYSSFFSIYLDPHGNVFPCIYFDQKVGNVSQTAIEELWNSEEMLVVRRKVRDQNCPNCLTECETNRSLYYDVKNYLGWKIKHYYQHKTQRI